MKKLLLLSALFIVSCNSQETVVPFSKVENVPEYPGCERGSNTEKTKCMSNRISNFVLSNYNTDFAGGLGLPTGQQKIDVIFKIDKNGDIKDIRTRGPHPSLEEEAIRVINKLPRMKPGRHQGETVTVGYSLPIMFTISDDFPDKNSANPPPPPPSKVTENQKDIKAIIRETFVGTEIDSNLTRQYGVKTLKDIIRNDTLGYFYTNGLTKVNYDIYLKEIEDIDLDGARLNMALSFKRLGDELSNAVFLIQNKSFDRAYIILNSLSLKIVLVRDKHKLKYYPFESGINYWLGVYFREIKSFTASKNYFKLAYNLEPNRF